MGPLVYARDVDSSQRLGSGLRSLRQPRPALAFRITIAASARSRRESRAYVHVLSPKLPPASRIRSDSVTEATVSLRYTFI
jgi:hypothetical protein